jgi:hypothetical protein
MTETPEKRRRRFMTLTEIVAVLGVLIAGLTLWNSWQERRDSHAEHSAEAAAAAAASNAERGRVGLVAAGKGGDTLAVKGSACTLQSMDVTFPKALGAAAQATVVDGQLRADWVAKPLLALVNGSERQGRLPVLIESRCEAADGERDEIAVYRLVWHSHGRLLRGQVLDLIGIAERQGVRSAAAGQARIDALWQADKPA